MSPHSLAKVTPVIAQTAGELLDVLVDILIVNMQGDSAVAAKVTLITCELIQATSLLRLWFPSPSLDFVDCLTLFDLDNLTVFSSMSSDLMSGHVVSVE